MIVFKYFKNFLRVHFKSLIKKDSLISKEYISNFLPEKSIIVEAGAHVGLDTIEMAKAFPKARIFAFEPVPNIFEQLKKNTLRYKNITCVQLGLSDKNGFSNIFVSSGASDGSSSLLKPKEHLKLHPKVKFDNSIKIETITLDSWIKKNNIEKIDFLWLDLQGMEYKVLKKSEKLLKSVKGIFAEVSLVENYSGGVLYDKLKDFLIKNNFVVDKEEIIWEDGGNVLFLKK
ncbi:MAG: FkbM family methyltransferase [Candidatus ainarchaeum sp.]|nr:FkbM family methyltransferase [Candidatus ainarchaeum sp.]